MRALGNDRRQDMDHYAGVFYHLLGTGHPPQGQLHGQDDRGTYHGTRKSGKRIMSGREKFIRASRWLTLSFMERLHVAGDSSTSCLFGSGKKDSVLEGILGWPPYSLFSHFSFVSFLFFTLSLYRCMASWYSMAARLHRSSFSFFTGR